MGISRFSKFTSFYIILHSWSMVHGAILWPIVRWLPVWTRGFLQSPAWTVVLLGPEDDKTERDLPWMSLKVGHFEHFSRGPWWCPSFTHPHLVGLVPLVDSVLFALSCHVANCQGPQHRQKQDQPHPTTAIIEPFSALQQVPPPNYTCQV